MTAKTCTVKEYLPNLGGKVVKLEVTGSTNDTTTLTLANYGIKSVEGVKGWVHATTDSVIKTQDPATSVSSGVLTLTFSTTAAGRAEAAYASKKYVFIVYGDSD